MSDGYKVTREGAVGHLQIDRPDRGNMITLAMLDDIAADIAKVGSDPAVNAILVTGKGSDFCRGRDPQGAPESKPTTAVEMRKALIEPILGVYAAVRDAEVPVIAAVQGTVQGLGCGIAAVCDVTIAGESATFSLPEMHANLPPTLAMLAHLDRIPSKSLFWMVMSRNQIEASRALAHGLVSEVVPDDEVFSTANAFLETLSGYERDSIVACKQYLQRARQADYRNANDLAGNMLSVVLSSRK
jgi:enoyl-CoA hydratase/carnithine racemase